MPDNKKLAELHVEDIDMMVRCVKNISTANKVKAENMSVVFQYHEGGLAALDGFKPHFVKGATNGFCR
jgi:hypothetical protein